jgi:hypothetical protein
MPAKSTKLVTARVPIWLESHVQQFAAHHKLSRSKAIVAILKKYFGYK